MGCAQAHRQPSAEVQGSLDAEKRPDYGVIDMLFIVGLVIVFVVFVTVVIIRRMLVPAGVKAAPHGWMSEQWLAEHRASHPP
jgi:hypothetical protein